MNNRITTYNRIVQSEKAEYILEQAKIHINTNILRPHFIGKNQSKNGELYRYMKTASQNGGFISTKYHSKDIITNRMFVCKSNLNVINLADPRILEAISSRYENGKIVCLDFKTFEPSIIKGILGDIFPSDIHTWSSNLLNISRSEAKKLNMTLLYCEAFETKAIEYHNELTLSSTTESSYMEYIQKMVGIRNAMENFVKSHIENYETNGYVVNSYGRKIYPKESRNIFSNIIQSIGSEILVDAIIELDEYIRGKESHLLFHRFDALYFDMSKSEIPKALPKMIRIMEGSGKEIQLNVGIQLGESMASLKDIELD